MTGIRSHTAAVLQRQRVFLVVEVNLNNLIGFLIKFFYVFIS
jgi:hypothetical protein